MKAPIVMIGIGELAGEFARGFLRCGYPVYPITRQMNMVEESDNIPEPALVLVMVPESELQSVLGAIPECWRGRIGLLQNELLPRDWRCHGLIDPTVVVVWFEKKKGMLLTPILYTPVYGPGAPLIAEALQVLDVSARILDSEDTLLYELVRKTVYILTVNICGLVTGGTVGDLWRRNQAFAREVAEEVIAIQQWLVGQKLPVEKLIAGMAEGIADCPHRNCVGRRAVARLQRQLAFARDAGLAVPHLTEIAGTVG